MQMGPSIECLVGNMEWRSEADDEGPLKRSELMIWQKWSLPVLTIDVAGILLE